MRGCFKLLEIQPKTTETRKNAAQEGEIWLNSISSTFGNSLKRAEFVKLITKSRRLFCSLRKSIACRCGCRGCCSLASTFEFTRWSLEAPAEGKAPAEEKIEASQPEGYSSIEAPAEEEAVA